MEKQLTEKESLAIITEMVSKVKNHYHENGAYLILWGSVIGVCGFVNAAQSYFRFNIGFDIWILTLIAAIPQVWLIVRESKRKKVKTHAEAAIDIIWMVYIITIIGIVLYGNITYLTSPRLLADNGIELFSKNISTGEVKPFALFAPSFTSIFLLVYGFPTLATGLITRYRPLITGALITYVFFLVSLFTSHAADMLLNGTAAVCSWLIPGLLLRKKYLGQLKQEDV